MIDGVQVVRYQRADRERVFTFLRDACPAADAARLMRHWNWKYEDNPFNPDREPYILLLQEHRQLVGMYGRLFFPAVIDGTVHLVHHGCDLVVHPAYRGHGDAGECASGAWDRRRQVDRPLRCANAPQPNNYDTIVVFNPGDNFNLSLPSGRWRKVFDINGAVSKTDNVCEGTAVTVVQEELDWTRIKRRSPTQHVVDAPASTLSHCEVPRVGTSGGQ